MKDSRKQFVLEAHKAACREWKTKIEKEFPSLFPKPNYEIGQWYKNNNTGCVINYQGGKSGYGFHWSSVWRETDRWTFKSLPMDWQPFTDREKLKELFIQEAKRRGLKHGNFDCLRSKTTLGKGSYPEFELDSSCNFWIYNNKCYSDGVWAKPFETITKEEAEKQLKKKIV